MLLAGAASARQQAGSIRGTVNDKNFEVPLASAQVVIAETSQRTTTSEDGHFVFSEVAPGRYTLVFSKEGYNQQVVSDVRVAPGQLLDVDASLAGEFTEMEEFVVEDLVIGGEAGLMITRFDSPSFLNAISAELMSQAGASDAAAALNLIPGATVQDGKYAVIRGLPDRYVVSLLNGVRLPSADEDKRAVELDQFPAAVISSIQISKTFTPDQQGDASGGAVNVVLKGIPIQNTLQFKSQIGMNSQATGANFLTSKGGGLGFWGDCQGDDSPQPDNTNWMGSVGVANGNAPIEYKWSASGGGRHEFDNGITIGGFASFFYEQDSSYFDNGIDDSWWVRSPGGPMEPETSQGTPEIGDFKTKLFDVTQGSDAVQWGGLATGGVESEFHSLNIAYLYTSTSDDTATLAEDTRGKEYFFPGYVPEDSMAVGNEGSNRPAAPYLRTETLECTERATQTLIFNGKHVVDIDDFGVENFLLFGKPELDWTYSMSSADLNQPDKRQFGSLWWGPSFSPGFPPFVPPFVAPATFFGYKPSANFTLGNLQRIWKEINEDSNQYSINLSLPFKQWSDSEGYFKFGVFNDDVDRKFNQDTFSNFNDNSSFEADWPVFWSRVFPDQDHPISGGPPFVDVDYKGNQTIEAWYSMIDLPLTPYLNLIGGARVESTSISIVNFPEEDALWFPDGSSVGVALNPGDADVDFHQDDVLPAIAFKLIPVETITLRGSYSQTIARQTFKELTPIIQQEFLGGPIFIGNPDLGMAALTNYDLRVDYTPTDGSLFSVSWFYKDVTDPIEYVQQASTFTYTTPVNYPTGWLTGFEFEARQDLGRIWENLEGLTVGANATFISSQVTLPEDEAAEFDAPNIMAPMSTRDMTAAPNHLYNLYLTYDLKATNTQFGLFYTVTGDTLVAGATVGGGNFVPNIYAAQYDTLNFTVTQGIGKHLKLFSRQKT